MPTERPGIAYGLANGFFPIGTAAGAAALGVVFTRVADDSAAGLAEGATAAMAWSAALCLLAAVLAVLLVRGHDLRAGDARRLVTSGTEPRNAACCDLEPDGVTGLELRRPELRPTA